MGFAVASGHALVTEAAEGALRAGGTAVDAVVAGAFTAFVTEPVLAQPLGGGFLMLAPETGPPALLDAFVQTPRRKRTESDLDLATVTVDFGTQTQPFHIGAGTIAVPCLVQALFAAHARHGRVPMRELAAPALRAAREGVVLTEFQAHVVQLVGPILTSTPEAAALHAPGGRLAEAGARLVNPVLADVLEVLAAEGPRFFTEGEIAAALLALPGSHLGAAEIREAQPEWRAPLRVRRQDRDLALNPPPSLGGVQVALTLSALPRHPAAATVAAALREVDRLRRELALDAVPERAAELALDPALVARLRAVLADHRPATRGTTHISVIAADGSGAALTLSNGEGCGRVLQGTGIMPNNMLGEEDLVAGGPLAWTPDRRLASMMCPVAMRDRDGTLTMLGSGGSNRIRSAIATVLLALIDQELGLEDAVAAPRMHVEDGALSFEDTDGPERLESLFGEFPEATAWDRPSMYFGGVHAARRRPSGAAAAAGDPRRAGCAATG